LPSHTVADEDVSKGDGDEKVGEHLERKPENGERYGSREFRHAMTVLDSKWGQSTKTYNFITPAVIPTVTPQENAMMLVTTMVTARARQCVRQ
jgi:hypothetical protein